MIQQNEELLFTCKDCGEHELIVIEYGTVVRLITETQECICGNDNDGVAYERTYTNYTPYVEAYLLDDDHHFHEKTDWEEDIDEPFTEELEENIGCEDCFNSTEERDIFEGDPEDYEVEDQEFFVRCANCKREIEFGWSHPERGGRIWPAESTDFNPWKSWPEPRYKEEWAKKNWLRPIKGR